LELDDADFPYSARCKFRARYRGTAKVHFQHLMTAAAINLRRTFDCFLGVPKATTRTTHFAALAPT
jgi:transposase